MLNVNVMLSELFWFYIKNQINACRFSQTTQHAWLLAKLEHRTIAVQTSVCRIIDHRIKPPGLSEMLECITWYV